MPPNLLFCFCFPVFFSRLPFSVPHWLWIRPCPSPFCLFLFCFAYPFYCLPPSPLFSFLFCGCGVVGFINCIELNIYSNIQELSYNVLEYEWEYMYNGLLIYLFFFFSCIECSVVCKWKNVIKQNYKERHLGF